MKKALFPLAVALVITQTIYAEGSKNLTPGTNYGSTGVTSNANDHCGYLMAAESASGSSGTAEYGSMLRDASVVSYSKEDRLYVYLKPGETAWFGLHQTGGAWWNPIDSIDLRIYYDDVSMGEYSSTVDDASLPYLSYSFDPDNTGHQGTIDDHTQAMAGPSPIYTGGYDALSFTNNSASNRVYWFVVTSTPNTTMNFDLWDVTVTSGNGTTEEPYEEHTGRLYCKFWAFDTRGFDNYVSNTFDMFTAVPDDNDNSSFYIKIIDVSGMRPYRWTMGCNNTGPQSTGAANYEDDRKSIAGNFSTKDYNLFVNNPDADIWPSTIVSNFSPTFFSVCNGSGSGKAFFSFQLDKPATVLVNVDLNSNGIYDGTDVLLEKKILTSGYNQIEWDGEDANGDPVVSGTQIKFNISAGFTAVHYPLYDIEENETGFLVKNVRPGGSKTEVLYWDDSNISGSTSLFGTLGPTHTWSGANSETHNSWSYGAIDLHEFFFSFDYDCTPNEDSDNDGIPNISESPEFGTPGTYYVGKEDYDNDGIPNAIDQDWSTGTTAPAGFTFVDVNTDGINDIYDTDIDGIPDYLDLDSDNDGIPDIIEAGGYDTDGNGIADDLTDTDGDGLVDVFDTAPSNASQFTSKLFDTDGNGSNETIADNDGDGVANYHDLDSDNDGIYDLVEVFGTDIDNNGLADNDADENANGFADILDPECGILKNITTPGTEYGATEISSTSVSNPTNALGLPASSYAELNANSDVLVIGIDETPISNEFTFKLGRGWTWGTAVANARVRYRTTGGSWSGSQTITTTQSDPAEYTITLSTSVDEIEITRDPSGANVALEVYGFSYEYNSTPNPVTVCSGGAGTPLATTLTQSGSTGRPSGYGSIDTDSDNLPNFLDIDSDQDGIVDVIEAQSTSNYVAPLENDSDGDGIDDAFDADYSGPGTVKGSMIDALSDVDGDDTPDYIDLNSDDHGGTDQAESGFPAATSNTDSDNDGLLDDYDNNGSNTINIAGADNNQTPSSFTKTGISDRDWRESPNEIIWDGTTWINGSDSGAPDGNEGLNGYIRIRIQSGTEAPMNNTVTIANLVIEENATLNVNGCLEVTSTAINDGLMRLVATSDAAGAYGQYLGPALNNVECQMYFDDGWHNVGFPIKIKASELDAQNNDTTTGGKDFFIFNNDDEKQNLRWYDSHTSGGKEMGFFKGDYYTHTYGTWLNVSDSSDAFPDEENVGDNLADEDLSTNGYSLYVDNRFSISRILKATGTTNDQDLTISTSNNFGGFNLIPNPYPVSLDVTAMYNGGSGFFTGDVDNVIYMWDPANAYEFPLPGQVTKGAYVAFDVTTGNAIHAEVDGKADLLIAPFQSFYIRRTSASTSRREDDDGTNNAATEPAISEGDTIDPLVTYTNLDLTMKPEYRSSCATTKHFKTSSYSETMILSVVDAEKTSGDAFELVFDDQYSEDYEKKDDIQKTGSSNGDVLFFSVLDNKALVINKMPVPTETKSVLVGILVNDPSLTYTIRKNILPPGWNVYLEDLKTKEWTDLTQDSYTFKYDVDYRPERFKVHFNLGMEQIIPTSEKSITAWGTNEGITVMFNNLTIDNADITVYNVLGQLLFEETNVDASKAFSIPLEEHKSKIYIITAETQEGVYSDKIIR